MNKKQIYILIAILGFLAVGVLLKTLQKPDRGDRCGLRLVPGIDQLVVRKAWPKKGVNSFKHVPAYLGGADKKETLPHV